MAALAPPDLRRDEVLPSTRNLRRARLIGRSPPRIARRWTRHGVRVVAALAVVYLVWGSTFLAIDVAIGSMPPMLMLAARFFLAGGALLLVAVRRGDRTGDRVTLRHVGQALVTGGTVLVAGTGLLVMAQSTLSSGLTALLGATVPLFLALFARGVFGERLSRRACLGLLVGLIGIGALVDPGGGHLGAILLALVASAAWAAGSLRSRVVDAPRRPMVAASLEMMGASLLFLVLAVLRGEPAGFELAAVAPSAWAAFVYLVVAGSMVAYSAYSWLMRNASTQLVSTFAYVNPVVAVTLGWAVLGEAVSPRMLLSGAVVLASVVLLITGRPGEPVPAQLTSGGDVFAGVQKWHRVRSRIGRLPRAARLYVDPGVRPYRRVGNEPPLASSLEP
jgi:drug/metabolite transporter (DMT)-like permease